LNLPGAKKITVSPNIKICFELLPLDILSQKLEVVLLLTLNQPGYKIYEFITRESTNHPVYVEIHGPTLNCNLIMLGEQATHVYCKETSSFEDTITKLNHIFSSRDMYEARIYKIELYLPLTEPQPIMRLLHALYLSTIMCEFEESLYFIRELERKVQEDLTSTVSFKKGPSCVGNIKREFRELKRRVEKNQLLEFLDQVQAFAKIYASCKA